MYLLLSILVNVCISANPNGKQTSTQIINYLSPNNLFLKNTFIENIISNKNNENDICKKYTSRKQFIKYLNDNNIKCNGRWCNGNYKYIKSSDSYEVEHIIDLKNSELNNCNKNIYGNIVLAYGLWNRQVGNLNWTYAKKEKKLVYKEIFDKAIHNIKKCDSFCEVKEDSYKLMDLIIALIFLGILAGIKICIIKSCCYGYKKLRGDENVSCQTL